MKTYETRTTEITVSPGNESIFSDDATTIRIEDEGAGEFISVKQPNVEEGIRLNQEEWPAIKNAIDMAVALCKDNKQEKEAND